MNGHDDTIHAGDTDLTRAAPVVGGDAPEEHDAHPVSRGRYVLGPRLGEGGMAVVVEAEDTTLRRPVAVKQLREALRHDAASRRQFYAEAEILAGLEHAGVVPVHDAGVLDGGGPFYAMAKVKGPTLADLLRDDVGAGLRVSLRHVDVVLRAAETVGYAHSRGLIHLDLKPQNIMVDDRGAVYVMDWGIARRPGAPAAAERGVVRGTPSYMSPEVASGRADLADARSDVFALGLILYEVLTGRRAFVGETSDLLQAIATRSPTAPRSLLRHVPRELSAICMKALAIDPAARYATAAALALDLRAYREFLPITAVSPSIGDRLVKWMKRHPRATTGLVTAALAVAVFGSVRAYRVASERAMLESLWAQYQTISSDVASLQSALDAMPASTPTARPADGALKGVDVEREEVAERLELRTNDARTIAAAAIGLTRGRPDPRFLEAMSARVRADIAQARAADDIVRVKVLVETRLELIDSLAPEVEWPAAERTFLRQTLEEAAAEIDRRLGVATEPSGPGPR
jgi:hypothetical protein